MSENRETSIPQVLHKPTFREERQAALQEQVHALKLAGVPDMVIAKQVGASLGIVKDLVSKLSLPRVTPQESYKARREYLQSNPNPGSSDLVFSDEFSLDDVGE